MQETIHIAYCLDDGYAEPTSVSMASMLANTKSNVHFHVISNRLSDENKLKITSLKEQFPHGEWSFHGIKFDETAFITSNYLSIETYYRLFLPAILPELERIIYIDGDTVIVGDIAELWNENLAGKIAGVVPGTINTHAHLRKSLLNFKYDWYYFNAGVLLLNLKEFSKLYTIEELPEIINTLYNKYIENNLIWTADQEVLNYLLNGDEHAKFLDIKYNLGYRLGTTCRITAVQPQNLKDYTNSCNFPVIIHFIGAKKPWHLNATFMPFKYYHLYYKYKALTLFYSSVDEERIAEYERRIQLTKSEAILNSAVYIQCFMQDIFNTAVQRTKTMFQNRKLVFYGVTRNITRILEIFAKSDLYPYAIVDGLDSNIRKSVFEYTVQSPKMLKGKANEYFIVLCMQTKKARDIVIKILKEYGYGKNDFVHAYAEVYERDEKL